MSPETRLILCAQVECGKRINPPEPSSPTSRGLFYNCRRRHIVGKRAIKKTILFCFILFLTSCGEFTSNQRTTEDFERYVSEEKIGSAADYWLLVKNNLGEWERVGLFFGYYTESGTLIECENAIKGLSQVNFLVDYRCEQAN
jgi:hypothetical protein